MTNKKIMTAILLTGITALSAGCTTTGTGEGDMTNAYSNSQSSSPVKFTWKSSDKSQQGTMTATVENDVYQGPFFQITSQTKEETLWPLWNGWEEGWDGWPYSYNDGAYIADYDTTQYITLYSGKVVANLKDTNGQRMRCRFDLTFPAAGLSGGGEGECQLPGGRSIDAVFDATQI